MTRLRWGLGLAGGLAAAYGGWLAVSRGHDHRDLAVWLAGGVLLHDGVLAGTVLVLGAVLLRVLPRAAKAPTAAGAVVLGSLTLLAVPVLGRFGARADNPTLLDRGYWAGWLVLAGLTVAGVVTASLLRSRRR